MNLKVKASASFIQDKGKVFDPCGGLSLSFGGGLAARLADQQLAPSCISAWHFINTPCSDLCDAAAKTLQIAILCLASNKKLPYFVFGPPPSPEPRVFTVLAPIVSEASE